LGSLAVGKFAEFQSDSKTPLGSNLAESRVPVTYGGGEYLKPQVGIRLPDRLLLFAYPTDKHFDRPRHFVPRDLLSATLQNDGKNFLQYRPVLSQYTVLDDNPINAESSPTSVKPIFRGMVAPGGNWICATCRAKNIP
jgi:hypothetical protein